MIGKIRNFVFLSLLLISCTTFWWRWYEEECVKNLHVGSSCPKIFFQYSNAVLRTNAEIDLYLYSSTAPEIVDQLTLALKLQPLDVLSMLDLAEYFVRTGDLEKSTQYISVGQSLWPNQSEFIWRAALVYLKIGKTEKSLELLRKYIQVNPKDSLRALAIVRRYLSDTNEIVNWLKDTAMTPSAIPNLLARPVIWRMIGDSEADLASGIWHASEGITKSNVELRRRLADALWTWKEHDKLQKLWPEIVKETRVPDKVINSGFETELRDYRLGWTIREKDGVQATLMRNAALSGDKGLSIKFDGTENVHYSNVSQSIPFSTSGRYVLSGFWRGDAVSTRSGVFVEVEVRHPTSDSQVYRTEKKFGGWDWTKFEIDFDVKESNSLADVRIRRNATDALDNLISGVVWFDDFTLSHNVE